MSCSRGLAAGWLLIRSVAWAALLPGLIAGYLPWRYFGVAAVRLRLRDPLHVAALSCIAAGVGLLAVCIWEFARSGRGTLAPVDPPRQLVVRGPYRYVRNPMYLGVATVIIGEVLLTRSVSLLAYLVGWLSVVHLFVIGYEEPTLRRRFGASYDQYTRGVRRWIPRV